jgi:lipoprotein-releasing system permease protein
MWLAWRYLRTGKGLMNLSTRLSMIGLVAGVGSLVIAMAVISGYESTLKRTLIDATSHLVVARTSGQETRDEFKDLLKSAGPFTAFTPFVFLEAVLAHAGKLSGVLVEGVEEATVRQVLRIEARVKAGEFSFAPIQGASAALIGKGLARKHGLKVGDRFKVVLPVSQEFDRGNVRPRISQFYVSAILDLGRHDFDERYVLTDLKTAQDFAMIGDRVSGYRFRYKDDATPLKIARDLERDFRPRYSVTTWYDINENLFRAVDLEKPVIFFVLLVIVIAAAFNVTSTLFVSVIRRFRDISILKSMGARRRVIIQLFTAQGLLLGFFGSLFGLAFGLLGCGIFTWAQNRWGLFPGEVYKIDHVFLEIRTADLGAILVTTWLICLIATWAPARRGATLPPVEGLRYE